MRGWIRLTAPIIVLAFVQTAIALQIKSPPGKKSLDPFGIYRVEIHCFQKSLPKQKKTFFTTNNVQAAHLIAISDQDYTGTFPTPDKTKAYTAVYLLNGTTANRNRFVNGACNKTFFLPTRKKLYLIAGASKANNYELRSFWQGLYAAFSVATSAIPLFTGAPIPKADGTRITAVNSTEGPIDKFIKTFDRGDSPVKNSELYQGTQTIYADYSRVTISVTRLRSIIGLKNNQFRADMSDQVFGLYKDKINSGNTIDQITGACRGIDRQMAEFTSLSEYDRAYSLSLLAQTGGLAAEQIVHCLGLDYALTVVSDFMGDKAKWMEPDWKWRQDQVFTAEDAATVLPSTPRILQPQFKDVAGKLNPIMGGLATYTAKDNPSDEDNAALGKFVSESVRTSDSTKTLETPEGTLTNKELMKELRGKGVKRFGCLTADSDSLAMFLGLPEKPTTNGKYRTNDALLLRLWINSTQKISSLRISFERPVMETIIKNSCDPGLSFVQAQ